MTDRERGIYEALCALSDSEPEGARNMFLIGIEPAALEKAFPTEDLGIGCRGDVMVVRRDRRAG